MGQYRKTLAGVATGPPIQRPQGQVFGVPLEERGNQVVESPAGPWCGFSPRRGAGRICRG